MIESRRLPIEAKSIKDGYEMALEALDNGKAKAKLEEIKKVSHAF